MKVKTPFLFYCLLLFGIVLFFVTFPFNNSNSGIVYADCCCGGGAWCADCEEDTNRTFCGGSSCTPGTCKGCTPSTPEGYTATNNGCAVTTVNTCRGSNGCDPCTVRKTFWLIETNLLGTVPPEWKPSNTTLIVGEEIYPLSTDPANPTKIDISSVRDRLSQAMDSNKTYKTNNLAEARSSVQGTEGRIPLGLSTSGIGDRTHVGDPSLVVSGGVYNIWYAGSDGSNWRIYYATSTNGGLTWDKIDNTTPANSNTESTNGRIPRGMTGTGDRTHVRGPSVIKDGDTYKMWYTGNDGSYWRIYYATSSDGLIWNKLNNMAETRNDTTGTDGRLPLGVNTSGIGDRGNVSDPAVIKDGSGYKMWYAGYDGSNWRIYMATSADGLTWTKVNNSTPASSNTLSTDGRIPRGESGTGDRTHVRAPSVVKDGDMYKMWYAGSDGSNWRIYYAYSLDGYTWMKEDNTIPANSDYESTNGRVPRGGSGRGDRTHVQYSTVVNSGDDLVIYYGGSDGSNWRIYRADIKNDYPIKVTMPEGSSLPTGGGIQYEFRANNYGTGGEWEPWVGCDGVAGEDFCSISNFVTQNFVPTSLAISQVLKDSSAGNIMGLYHSVNRCDSGTLEGEVVNGYYIINNPPVVEIPCPSDTSLRFDDPMCEESSACDDIYDEDCANKVILPEIGSDITEMGCESDEYTGKDINNPLKVRIAGSDSDGNEDIEGVMLILNREGTDFGNALPKEGDYTYSGVGILGIMLVRDGNDPNWDKEPLIYGLTYDNRWALLDDGKLLNSEDNEILRVIDIEEVKYGDLVTFEFKLNFNSNSDLNPEGLYNFDISILDRSMVGNLIDHTSVKSYFKWGIDLEDPRIENLGQKVIDAQELFLNWEAYGTGSYITDIVLNGYREVGLDSYDITLLSPPGYENKIELGDISGVTGSLKEEYLLNSWHYPDLNSGANPEDPYVDFENTRINIGLNAFGSIIMYVTAYDKACNYASKPHNIDLRSWIATKGGIMYSQGGFGPAAKLLEEEKEERLIQALGLAEGRGNIVLGDRLLTGTGLISSSRRDTIRNIVYPELKGVVAEGVYDTNDRKSFWYDYLIQKLLIQKELIDLAIFEHELLDDEEIGLNTAEKCLGNENCIISSSDNIVVPSGFECQNNTLILSGGNIILEPNVNSSEGGIKGCIFLAKGDIEIGQGDYQSLGSDTVRYDYLDAFLIAERQIVIKEGDLDKAVRDGLLIFGSALAFGRDLADTSAIVLNRNLRLFNYDNPTLVVSWAVKYTELAEIFFGTESPLYKQEVGFKAH